MRNALGGGGLASLVGWHAAVTLLLVTEFILLQAVAVGITTVVYSLIPALDAGAQPSFDDWRRLFQVVSPTVTITGGAGIVLSSILFARQTQEARAETQEARAETQEARAETQEVRSQMQEARAETQEARQNAEIAVQAANAETQEARAEAQIAQARLEAAQANERAAKAEAELLRLRLAQLEEQNGNANGQSAV